MCIRDRYPLAQNEMSFLLPHFLAEGRGKLDTYFIRVYNPVWTNPDGLSWMEVLTDESKIGGFAALTPTWSESAYLADSLQVGVSAAKQPILDSSVRTSIQDRPSGLVHTGL